MGRFLAEWLVIMIEMHLFDGYNNDISVVGYFLAEWIIIMMAMDVFMHLFDK